jgi:hypothetical protein
MVCRCRPVDCVGNADPLAWQVLTWLPLSAVTSAGRSLRARAHFSGSTTCCSQIGVRHSSGIGWQRLRQGAGREQTSRRSSANCLGRRLKTSNRKRLSISSSSGRTGACRLPGSAPLRQLFEVRGQSEALPTSGSARRPTRRRRAIRSRGHTHNDLHTVVHIGRARLSLGCMRRGINVPRQPVY